MVYQLNYISQIGANYVVLRCLILVKILLSKISGKFFFICRFYKASRLSIE